MSKAKNLTPVRETKIEIPFFDREFFEGVAHVAIILGWNALGGFIQN